MNTTQLECFIAVANTLNFARAAAELHITQPAVTHQINSLEAELETKLFTRTTRSVTLTQDGLIFWDDASRILQSTRQAKAKLSSQSAEAFSVFSIGCHNSTELKLLPPILCEFTRKYPHIHPILKTIPFRSLENLLNDGTLDVTFDFKNAGPEKKNMAYLELQKTRLMCALPKDHPYAAAKTITAQMLSTEKLILQEPPKLPPALFTLQKPLAESHPPKDIYFCENTEAALILVKAGLGITMVLDLEQLREPDLCYLPFENPAVLSYGIHYKKLQQTAILKDFLAISKKNFTQKQLLS